MLQALIAPVKRALTDALERLVGRVVVSLLLVIAGGFAIAALLIKLTEMWGAVWACLAAAGVFAFIALIAAAVIYANEQKQEEPEAPAQPEEAPSESSDFAGTLSNLVVSDPVTAMSTASAAVGLYRKLGRRTSILLITLIAAAVLWSRLSGTQASAAPPPAPAE